MEIKKLYRTKLPSDLAVVGNTVDDVVSRIKAVCYTADEGVLFDVRVVLNELLVNAIRHGNQMDQKKHVKLSVGLFNEGYLFCYLEDEGEGFSRGKCGKSPCTEGMDDWETLMESGRGLIIVENLCDRVKRNVKGNRVVVLKHI